MPGLTHTLDVARRALMAQQSVLSVIGHNIANANTPGYARQIAHLQAEAPQLWGGRQWGNGVTLAAITQRRTQLLDQRLRAELSGLGGWRMRATVLAGVEELLQEPSERGLGATLDAFFSAWSGLSSNPEDMALRAQVLAQSQVLAERFREMDGRMERVGREVGAQIDIELAAFNEKLAAIESVSRQIAAAEQGGGRANDLRDRRAQWLDELSEVADLQWSEGPGGAWTLRAGGRVVLDQSGARPLRRSDLNGAVSGGSLGGLLELQAEGLPALRERLDLLARDLIAQVNALHRAGPSQSDFFSGGGAGDMAVSATIAHDLTALNVSTSGLEGENDIALAIGQLRESRIIDRLGMTPGEYWSAFTGRVGTLAGEARFQAENAEWTAAAAQAARDAQQGVSLDEELAAMVSTQNAYLAAARVFDIASQMMDTLLRI
ncbi:MAG: flagellar hook-associated protein FlgK [Candidatus Eisenbacteria bacterium]|uniref:Flagellar hook-associated protein 1 n=1 Tax=Eiseniibacteriota bacterium TaxID=2212470 RepID=A0A938BN79_UNCEI|nr:flagellar hook-associated protein FlgK [Candidatus Eisenbacteria bacterium]